MSSPSIEAVNLSKRHGSFLALSNLSLNRGFTFFFSPLFKSSSMLILVAAILFLFAFSLIQLIVSGLAQIEPWFIITCGSGIIGNVLMDTYPTTQPIRGAGPGGRAGMTYAATIPEGITILLVYFIAAAILGLVLFERKEFTYIQIVQGIL